MAQATHTIPMSDGKEPDLTDLESPIMDLVSVTRIADEMVERLLSPKRKLKLPNGFFTYTVAQHEVNDILWMLGEAQHRAALLSDAFYAASEGRS